MLGRTKSFRKAFFAEAMQWTTLRLLGIPHSVPITLKYEKHTKIVMPSSINFWGPTIMFSVLLNDAFK